MNTHPNMFDTAAPPVSGLQKALWSHRLLGFVLAFWLGGSALLDFVVMPTLYTAGMMDSTSFASAGESLFLTFNSLEMILGAIVVAAVLAHRHEPNIEAHRSLGGLGLPLLMLSIAMLFRYLLTPQMAAMGVQLDWMTKPVMPDGMMLMHMGYWVLETVKLAACAVLLNRCFRMPI
ncbi:DUF4149 domain-containing protein [filamentous cyanobacterium LEGE 11480]|uniref:DUF4149 domain-containing protein n=1 Tax=Romeriopsis navalis LEGE 11480 TaxID=2777977 RepID=A0A928VM82_9CYAN|nr:DUF4149 domain-containing protein [Romeriopsis navalis]MBE9028419.1 DUF4149 domain-containing protein [Romeriopsis navalis LEGE 11480]